MYGPHIWHCRHVLGLVRSRQRKKNKAGNRESSQWEEVDIPIVGVTLLKFPNKMVMNNWLHSTSRMMFIYKLVALHTFFFMLTFYLLQFQQPISSLNCTQPSFPCSLAFLPCLPASLLTPFPSLACLLIGMHMPILLLEQNRQFNKPLFKTTSKQMNQQKRQIFIECRGNKQNKKSCE